MTERALPRWGLGKTIAYTSGLWSGLVCFRTDPKVPLDINSVERGLRAVAIGTRVIALFYSLIESAKPCGLELRAVRNPGTVELARDLKSARF